MENSLLHKSKAGHERGAVVRVDCFSFHMRQLTAEVAKVRFQERTGMKHASITHN